MPTTRTPIARSSKYRITSEMVNLYRRAREIAADDDHSFWEAEGGKRREWLDISVELHAKLGRELWQTDVCDLLDFGDEPPIEISKDPERVADWREAVAIRDKLEEALRAGPLLA